MFEYQKEAGKIRITIVWALPPAQARYRRAIGGENVQVEVLVCESDGNQSKSEHTTVLQHESSGEPDTGSEDSIGDG